MSDFGELQQVDAGVLTVGYAEAGPANGPAVLLLHGWPYDIHSYVEVAPSGETFRNGQQSVLAQDTIALMDALETDKAIVAGFDWGARTANIVAALWPERCKALVSVSEGEPEYDDLEQRLAKGPAITVPTITLEGDANGAPHRDPY